MSIDKTIEAIKALPRGEVVIESAYSYSEPKYLKNCGIDDESLQALVAHVERLETALRHYAHSGNWGTTNPEYNHPDLYIGNSMRDGQRIAKEALDSKGKERE